jgi:predicted nucleic acid-binding protein
MEFLRALSGQRVYLDTNIFIYAYEAHPSYVHVLTRLFEAIERGDVRAVTSELSLAEVLVMPIKNKNRSAQKAYRQALQNSANLVVHPINRDILAEAARLRATSQLTLPDAIHVTTARAARCYFVVTNDAQFSTALGIRVVLLSEIAKATKPDSPA